MSSWQCVVMYGTNRRQGKCVLHMRVVCKRVALLSTTCERVCLDVLTCTFVLYHTSTVRTYTVTTYYLQELTYMDCRLQSQATAEKLRLD